MLHGSGTYRMSTVRYFISYTRKKIRKQTTKKNNEEKERKYKNDQSMTAHLPLQFGGKFYGLPSNPCPSKRFDDKPNRKNDHPAA
jgi:hypothetical protein